MVYDPRSFEGEYEESQREEPAQAEARVAYWNSPEGKLALRAQELSGDYGDVRGIDPKNVPAIENILKQIGTENVATKAMAATLAQKYGISDLNQIELRPKVIPAYTESGGSDESFYSREVPEQTVNEWYNKTTGQVIPQSFATYDDGKATYFFGLDKTKDGNLTFNQPREPNARATGMKNEAMMALALASLAFDWSGSAGYAILGAGDAIAGAIAAGEIAASISAATGITVSAGAIATGIGAATVNTATTYARTGDINTALATGASSFVTGVGAAAAGGTVGNELYYAGVDRTLTNYLSSAVAGAAGTALSGGSVDLGQMVNGALATAAGVGVTNAAAPFVGVNVAKGLGAAAQTYVSTGNTEAAVQNGLFSGVGSAIRSSTSQTQTPSTGDAGADEILRASESVGRVPGTGLQVASSDGATQYTLAPVTITASRIDKAFEGFPDWVKQIVATSAQGFGQQIETFANAYSAITGKSFSNTMANFGHNMSIWGANRDSTDLAAQTRAFEADITKAESLPWYQSPVAIVQSAIRNPLGAISKIGQERIQEIFPTLAGVVTAAAGVYFGAPVATAVALGAAGSALVDAFESFGSGAKEGYDASKRAGASEAVARSNGVLNGTIHALVTAPAEFIADKALFKSYTDGLTKGLTGLISQYGSANVREFGSEVLETYAQAVSTAATTGQKFDPRAATAQAFTAGLVSSGTHAGMTSEKLIKDAVVAKDFSGKNVTLGEMMSGSKLVDPATIKTDAVIATSANGAKQTVGYATAAARELGITAPQLSQVLPPSMLSNDLVIATLPGGTPVTIADMNRFEESGGTPEAFMSSLSTANPVTFASFISPAAAATESRFATQTFFDNAVDQKIAAGASPLDATRDTLSSMGLPANSVSLTALGKTLGGQNNAVAAITTPTIAPNTTATTAPVGGGNTAGANLTLTSGAANAAATDSAANNAATAVTSGVDPNAATNAAVTTAVNNGADPNATVNSALNGAVTTGADPNATVNSALNGAASVGADTKTANTIATIAAANTAANNAETNAAANTAANNAATAVTSGVDPNAATNAAVTTAVNNGANTNAAVNGAVTGAVTAGANTNAAVNGAVTGATSVGADSNTAAAVANNAATNAATDTSGGVDTTQTYTGPATGESVIIGGKKYDLLNDGGAYVQNEMGGYTHLDATEFAALGQSAAAVANNAATNAAANAGTGANAGTNAAVNSTVDAATNAANNSATNTLGNAATNVAATNAAGSTVVNNGANTNATTNVATNTGTNMVTGSNVTSDQMNDINTKIDGLSGDVASKFDSLTQGQRDLVSSQVKLGQDVNQAINNVLSSTAQQISGAQTNFTNQINSLSGDVKTKFDSLSQGQQAIVTAQVQQGASLNQAINNVATSTAQQIGGIKTDVSNQINSLSSDVKTKFDSLSQSQQNLVASQVQQGIDLNQAINNVATSTAQQIGGIKTDVSNQINSLSSDVKTKFDSLSQSQQAIVAAQVQQGIDLNQAINNATVQTNQNIANVKTDITQNINTVQEQFNARVDELVRQGQDYQTATQTALGELGAGVTSLQSQVTAEAEARQAAADEANRNSANQKAMQLVAPAAKQGSSAFGASSAAPSAAAAGALAASVIGGKSGFVSPLEAFSKLVQSNEYVPQQQQQPEGALMQSSHYSYGQPTDLNEILGLDDETDQVEQQAKAGGLMTPLMAAGGTTRYGKFAGGGLNVVHHAGKMRVDFRRGDAVTGAGDGQSDDIPAMLADGEFVIPADVVAALGNGSTKAGSDALYEMMHSIRSRARKGHPKSLPPPAKSPLDYISKRK